MIGKRVAEYPHFRIGVRRTRVEAFTGIHQYAQKLLVIRFFIGDRMP